MPAVTLTTHRQIDVGGIRLHVAEAGPEDGPLVVFLHGFPEFWWSWRHQIDAFAMAGFRVVAPDLRGYNESDKPEGVRAYEVEALAGDVAGLIRALGRTEATIVGHDWGAVVAWSFAMFHGAMTTRLAILNVPHPVAMLRGLRTLRQLRKSWYVFAFQLPRLPEWAIARNDFAFIRQTFAADGVPAADIERYVLALRQPGAVSAAVNYYRAGIRRGFAGRQAAISPIAAPVLVIWGDRDRYLGSELATPPADLVPNARVVHIPEASHWVQTAAPVRVNQLLLDFVRS